MNLALKILFQAVSLLGTPFFFVPAIIYLSSLDKNLAIITIYSIALAQIVCTAIKFIYPKKRPVPMPDKTLIQKYLAGSFPSIHTARITAFSVPIIQFHANQWIILAALSAIGLVGYSRICLKKHYLIDVTGGILIGAFIGIVSYILL
jgi:undecaprenyl-diphosphatase